jgi:hypothetical protein
MKWKTTKSGEQRIATYFALLPTELDDGYTVWLQKYYSVETWDDGTTSTGIGYWKTTMTSSTHPHRPNTGSFTQ